MDIDGLENFNKFGKNLPVWNSLPPRLNGDENYFAMRDFILNHQYDFLMTITFFKRQHDDVVIKSVSHLLNVLNASVTDQRFRKTGRFIKGFAMVERHIKSIDKEGALHLHILGYFPNTFHTKPTISELTWKLYKAIRHVCSKNGEPMITSSGIDIREPYSEDGLMNYLSKQLNPDNLHERILFVGAHGLTGWTPERNEKSRWYSVPKGFWNPRNTA